MKLWLTLLLLAIIGLVAPVSGAQNAADATFSTVTANGYGTDDLNAVGIVRDNLITIGSYQYMAYFGYTSQSNAPLYVARRAVGSGTWTSIPTGYSDTIGTDRVVADAIITNGIDDHDVVAMAVDGNGDMHLSWGMHNVGLNYGISTARVDGSTFDPTFTTLTSSTSTKLPPNSNSATYPEFYYEPNGSGGLSGNLLFLYRNGSAGNGNEYTTTYNAATASFVNDTEVLNGTATSVNGYQNSLSYDSKGNLLMSWVWRGTSGYQTNSGMFFAQSPDNGVTWTQQNGTPYALPIVSSGSNPAAVGQSLAGLAQIPNGSSLINATTTAVDANNNPLIATWYTPSGITSGTSQTTPESGTGNANRQYELIYYTGTQWKTSQVGNRQNDTKFDGAGSDVRDLARPLVLVDKSGRVLVVTRSEDSGLMGGNFSSTLTGNNIVVYWNTVASLDSSSPNAWQSITLDSTNLGEWEPSYDQQAWSTNNHLQMLFQISGLADGDAADGTGAGPSGETNSTISVLDWNEEAYFASTPEPAPTGLLSGAAMLYLHRRPRRMVHRAR